MILEMQKNQCFASLFQRESFLNKRVHIYSLKTPTNYFAQKKPYIKAYTSANLLGTNRCGEKILLLKIIPIESCFTHPNRLFLCRLQSHILNTIR